MILMETNMRDLRFLTGAKKTISETGDIPVLSIFDSMVVSFLNEISNRILSAKERKQHPDILTFGFWCRESNIRQMAVNYADQLYHYGRGLVFHVVPSNLPIIFSYSLVAGLLAGNANILKLPSKDFKEIFYLCSIFQEVLSLDSYTPLSPYITCVIYHRENIEYTKYFSSICDARVIWGGDHTIDAIRKIPIRPGSIEVTFPNRYSICVINSEAWLECKNKQRIIRGFYTDTYLFDQNACSAPILVAWTGKYIKQAQNSFWSLLSETVLKEYVLPNYLSVKKLESFYQMSVDLPGISLSSTDNYIVRVWSQHINQQILNYRPGGGFFVECAYKRLTDLKPLLGKRCQTIAYYGIDKDMFLDLLQKTGPHGVDRIVPIGQTLDFSLTWDGYDLIRSLSRSVHILDEN